MFLHNVPRSSRSQGMHSNARNAELAEPYNKALATLTKLTETQLNSLQPD